MLYIISFMINLDWYAHAINNALHNLTFGQQKQELLQMVIEAVRMMVVGMIKTIEECYYLRHDDWYLELKVGGMNYTNSDGRD